MNFGEALTALKNGNKLARMGWNGKNMWIILVPGSKIYTTTGSAYRNA